MSGLRIQNQSETKDSVLQTFSHVISQIIVSREALILDRQFIYKEQTHTQRKESNDGPKNVGR